MAHAACGHRGPQTDEHGTLELAQIGTYGETVHTFVSRARYGGTVLEPGYGTENLPPTPIGPEVGLVRIDHVVGNVEKGKLDDWVRFYGEVLGFGQLVHFDDSQIATEYSALMSTVVWDGSKIVMPINEPADGKKKSQIQEYVDDLRRPRRAAHRAAHGRHRRHGPSAAGPRRAVHVRARHVLRRGQASAWPSSTCRGSSCSG